MKRDRWWNEARNEEYNLKIEGGREVSGVDSMLAKKAFTVT